MMKKLSVSVLTCVWLACGVPDQTPGDDGGVKNDGCGTHGVAHGDHCDCDSGYTEVGGTCVVKAGDAGTGDAGSDPCGPNGKLHGDHCHCDNGYTEAGGTCVALTDPCGPHGETHGDHCDCDNGYTEVGGTCVAATDPCGPHGELRGDHCDCDNGYTEIGGTCVVVTVDGGSDPCGPHGETHGGHCDCDTGYEEVGGTCVAVMADGGADPCGPHGETHGGHCHCDNGYVEVGGTCVPVVADGGADPCAPHGELHGDHCDCDDGYIADGLSCVPVVVEACGDGHRHGATCVCYAGFIYSAAEDTCVPFVPPAMQETISFTILALGEDGTSSGINAVNEHLQIVGNKRPPGETFLSAYTQQVQTVEGDHVAGPITDIGILPGSSNQFSRPWDINVHGVVAGESGNNNPVLPFIYAPGTGLVALSLPSGSASAVAHGINDLGQLVGIGNSRAITWENAAAVPVYLPSIPGSTIQTSRAWKINVHGDIVGHARNATDQQRAVWWKPAGDMVDLGTLNPSYTSEALDINAGGVIVGKSNIGVVPGSTSGTLQTQAFLFENGSMRGLGLLPSAPLAVHSIANAINDDGWVVGQVEQIAGLAQRAVLWRDGVIEDLNDYLPPGSGWVLTSAVDVNNHGDIVGRGTLNGTARPFVLIRSN